MASPNTQQANAIRAITNRSNVQIPDVDFTQHELENGDVVITTERVVKDVSWLASAGRSRRVKVPSRGISGSLHRL